VLLHGLGGSPVRWSGVAAVAQRGVVLARRL